MPTLGPPGPRAPFSAASRCRSCRLPCRPSFLPSGRYQLFPGLFSQLLTFLSLRKQKQPEDCPTLPNGTPAGAGPRTLPSSLQRPMPGPLTCALDPHAVCSAGTWLHNASAFHKLLPPCEHSQQHKTCNSLSHLRSLKKQAIIFTHSFPTDPFLSFHLTTKRLPRGDHTHSRQALLLVSETHPKVAALN